MTWQIDRIRPPEPPPKVEVVPSFALGRLCGSIGFVGTGLLVAEVGRRLLGLDQAIWDQPQWTGPAFGVVVVSSIVALLGMAIGWGVASVIKVRDNRVDHLICAVWHFLANGGIAAFLLWSLILVNLFGKEGSKLFVRNQGSTRSALITIGISTGACVVASLALILIGLLKPRRRVPFLPCLLVALPWTLGAAYLQFRWLGLDSAYWLFLGIALPAAVIPFSAAFIDRDVQSRERFLARHPEKP
jgi:hypothetical protein